LPDKFLLLYCVDLGEEKSGLKKQLSREQPNFKRLKRRNAKLKTKDKPWKKKPRN